jgi:hypothetical protein
LQHRIIGAALQPQHPEGTVAGIATALFGGLIVFDAGIVRGKNGNGGDVPHLQPRLIVKSLPQHRR